MVIWVTGSERRVRAAQAEVEGPHCRYLAIDCSACWRLPEHESVPKEHRGGACPNNPLAKHPEDIPLIQKVGMALDRGSGLAEDVSDGLKKAPDLTSVELLLMRTARRRQADEERRMLAREIIHQLSQAMGEKPGGGRGSN